jgi:5'-AMP-activated protein kinase regulatory beta subunit
LIVSHQSYYPISFLDESYLASIANKVGVNILASSPQSTDVDDSEASIPSRAEATSLAQPEATTSALVDKSQGQAMLPQMKDDVTKEKSIPIVFHWDHGGNDVYVCGSFNNWRKIPMNKSRGNFTAIVELTEGVHQYKFHVDGDWVHDSNEQTLDNGLGTLNNIVNVTQKDFDVFNQTIDLSSLQKGKGNESPPGSYDQLIPQRSATTGLPPHLPPLLQQTILNQEPPAADQPRTLPDPNHVSLNHLYALSIKDGVLVMGATNRYKDKYITTLVYKPVQ